MNTSKAPGPERDRPLRCRTVLPRVTGGSGRGKDGEAAATDEYHFSWGGAGSSVWSSCSPRLLGLDATRPLRTQAGRVSAVSWLPRGGTQPPSHSGQTLSGPHCFLHTSTLLPLPPGAPQLVPVTGPGPTAESEEWSGEGKLWGYH